MELGKRPLRRESTLKKVSDMLDDTDLDEVQQALESWISSSTSTGKRRPGERPALDAPKDRDLWAKMADKRMTVSGPMPGKRGSGKDPNGGTGTPDNAELKEASEMGLMLLRRSQALASDVNVLREELAARDARIIEFQDGLVLENLVEEHESRLELHEQKSATLEQEVFQLRNQKSSSDERSQNTTHLARTLQKQASSQVQEMRVQVTDLTARLRAQQKELAQVQSENSRMAEEMDSVKAWFQRLATLQARIRRILVDLQGSLPGSTTQNQLKTALSLLDLMGKSGMKSPRSEEYGIKSEPVTPGSRRNSASKYGKVGLMFLETMLTDVEPEAEDPGPTEPQGPSEVEVRCEELIASEQRLMEQVKSEQGAAVALHEAAQQALGHRCPQLFEVSVVEAATVLSAFQLQEVVAPEPPTVSGLGDVQIKALEIDCNEAKMQASRLRSESVRLKTELDEAQASKQMTLIGDENLQKKLLQLHKELNVERSQRSDCEVRLRRAVQHADALAVVAEELTLKQEQVVIALEQDETVMPSKSLEVGQWTSSSSTPLRGSESLAPSIALRELPSATFAETEFLKRLDRNFQQLRGQLESLGVADGATRGLLNAETQAATKDALAQIAADSNFLNQELRNSEAKCQQLEGFLNRAAVSLEGCLKELYENTTEAMSFHSSELQRLEDCVNGLTHHVNAHLGKGVGVKGKGFGAGGKGFGEGGKGFGAGGKGFGEGGARPLQTHPPPSMVMSTSPQRPEEVLLTAPSGIPLPSSPQVSPMRPVYGMNVHGRPSMSWTSTDVHAVTDDVHRPVSPMVPGARLRHPSPSPMLPPQSVPAAVPKPLLPNALGLQPPQQVGIPFGVGSSVPDLRHLFRPEAKQKGR